MRATPSMLAWSMAATWSRGGAPRSTSRRSSAPTIDAVHAHVREAARVDGHAPSLRDEGRVGRELFAVGAVAVPSDEEALVVAQAEVRQPGPRALRGEQVPQRGGEVVGATDAALDRVG